MQIVDFIILGVYFVGMLGVGVYFQRRQTGLDEYFVGGRDMGAGHIGLSVVATDVGGGFSIGLGGLGFVMGLSASWLLFSGLIGAWLAAVLLVPRVKALGDAHTTARSPTSSRTVSAGRRGSSRRWFPPSATPDSPALSCSPEASSPRPPSSST